MESAHTTPALEPAIIAIFGITGDLAQRKLLPALYHLVKEDLLHEHTVILGLTRQSIDVDQLLSKVELCVNEIDGLCDPATVAKLKSKLQMLQLDISGGDSYEKLREKLDAIEDQHQLCMNRLFYLAIPPQVTDTIINLLGKHKLHEGCQHKKAQSRLLIEKPFGYDLNSAKEIIATITIYFREDQIFRIDHYLAKETVQNILTFRYSNTFENLWNNEYISHVLITAAETIGVEGRSTFYEQVGALRDFVQSHLLQLVALVTLDLPPKLTSDGIHSAKAAALKNFEPLQAEDKTENSIRGQYQGYGEEVSNPTSSVETFAALKLFSSEKRWEGVPFFIRTGKALAEKRSEIRIVFKAPNKTTPPNVLVFRLQPKEGIELDLQIKKPGFDYEVQSTAMNFNYQDNFAGDGHPDAYERVLVDAVRGDHTLFATSDEVLAAWRIIEPLIQKWSRNSSNLELYPQNSWGPEAAEKLVSPYYTDWEGNATSTKK